MITSERLRELKAMYEKELLFAEARISVINEMIAESEKKADVGCDDLAENIEEVAIQNETIGETL